MNLIDMSVETLETPTILGDPRNPIQVMADEILWFGNEMGERCGSDFLTQLNSGLTGERLRRISETGVLDADHNGVFPLLKNKFPTLYNSDPSGGFELLDKLGFRRVLSPQRYLEQGYKSSIFINSLKPFGAEIVDLPFGEIRNWISITYLEAKPSKL